MHFLVHILIVLLGGAGVGLVSWSLKQGGARTCENCHKQMMAEWPKCLFCGHVPGAASAAGKTAMLHFVTGPPSHRDQGVVLEKSVVTIGSAEGNDVVLKDTGVSRKHVGIRKVDGGYELADFGSTNGVYVNGERVPRKRLSIGDVVRVGNTEMVFRTAG